MLDECTCAACGNSFYKTAIGEDGRCSLCVKENRYSGDTEEVDYIETNKNRKLELKVLIKEVLEEMKEEERVSKMEKMFEPRKCKKCGAEFIPMAPANLYCNDCKGSN